METAWIQIFILTIAECVAPEGKTVCQESQFELQFLTLADCEVALEQLIDLKSESEKVIVDASKSSCKPSAVQREVYASLTAISSANRDTENWRAPDVGAAKPRASNLAHQERLATLKTCDEAGGVRPCRIGEIIIEDADKDDVEVWRKQN